MLAVLQVLDVAVVPIIVALIAVTPMLISNRKGRKENSEQHAQVSTGIQYVVARINSLDAKIDRVESKIDRHLGEHDAQQTFSARAPRAKAANR